MRALLLCAAVAGCASYTSLPLPGKPRLAMNASGLRHDGVDLAGPLMVADVARLALQNDPDLRSAAAEHALGRAQLLQAGLLPNPQVSANVEPVVAGPGTTTAYSGGLSFDIRSLITRPARLAGARADAARVDSQLLWQAWQVAGQARLLAVQLIYGNRLAELLEQSQDLLDSRAARGKRALAQGDTTILTVAPDIAAAQAMQVRRDTLRQTMDTQRHALDALLGLAPGAPLRLSDRVDLSPLDPRAIDAAIASLPERPDLAALRYGYGSQDAAVRLAILSQIPTLTVGLTGGSDTTNVKSIGPQVNIDLPVFDRNQGNIAIATATRRRLRDDYAARLDAASGQIRALLAERGTLSAQLDRVQHEIPAADRMAAQARTAFAAGNIDERGYVDLIVTRIDKRAEAIALQQALDEQRVSLDTLIGADMPRVSFGGA